MGADYLSFNAGKSLPRGQAVVRVNAIPRVLSDLNIIGIDK